jgi:hypothetical protein
MSQKTDQPWYWGPSVLVVIVGFLLIGGTLFTGGSLADGYVPLVVGAYLICSMALIQLQFRE